MDAAQDMNRVSKVTYIEIVLKDVDKSRKTCYLESIKYNVRLF